MKEKELKESIDKLCRGVVKLTEAVSTQNELSKKALLLEQRRQLMQSGGPLLEAVPQPGPDVTPRDGTV